MKRLILAPILLAVSLIISGAEYIYINTSTDSYIAMLKEADEHILASENARALSVAERLERRFNGQTGMFNIFMYHSEVSHISSDLAMLTQYARAGTAADFLATSACAKQELKAIKYSKKLSWENIF